MTESHHKLDSPMRTRAEAHARTNFAERSDFILSTAHLSNAASLRHQNCGQLHYFPRSSSASQSSMPQTCGGLSSLSASVEHTKHRRTKSGCYTCRKRRVKCDETHPICERCRKGSRDCAFPSPLADEESSRAQEATALSNYSSPSYDTEQEEAKPIAVPLRNEDGYQNRRTIPRLPLQRNPAPQASENSVSICCSLPLPSLIACHHDEDFAASQSRNSELVIGRNEIFSKLPDDYRALLEYFHRNVTCHHYCLANKEDNFFVQGIVAEASRNKLLLNALVSFSSYLQEVREPRSTLYNFLLYYNRSITLLLELLKHNRSYNLPALLGILQLATIEEYMGDWTNMMNHQRAALVLFTNIYTPQTVMKTQMGRICLYWYARFDLKTSLFGMIPSKLSRDWLTSAVAFYQEKAEESPSETRWKEEDWLARLQLIRYDMSVLFCESAYGRITDDEFAQEHGKISKRLTQWRENQTFNLATPNLESRASSILAFAEWHMLKLLLTPQAMTIPREKRMEIMIQHGVEVRGLFEYVLSLWRPAHTGLLLGVGSFLAVVAQFLPKNDGCWNWLWPQFTLLENFGYFQPTPFRKRIEGELGGENMIELLLPNDKGLSKTLRNIRETVDERLFTPSDARIDCTKLVEHLSDKLNSDRGSSGAAW